MSHVRFTIQMGRGGDVKSGQLPSVHKCSQPSISPDPPRIVHHQKANRCQDEGRLRDPQRWEHDEIDAVAMRMILECQNIYLSYKACNGAEPGHTRQERRSVASWLETKGGYNDVRSTHETEESRKILEILHIHAIGGNWYAKKTRISHETSHVSSAVLLHGTDPWTRGDDKAVCWLAGSKATSFLGAL